jgi:hypothetical protein
LGGGVIPKDLADLLDSYISNPNYENSLALIKFDPKFIAFNVVISSKKYDIHN